VLRCVRKSCVFVLASMLKLSLNVFSQRVRVSVKTVANQYQNNARISAVAQLAIASVITVTFPVRHNVLTHSAKLLNLIMNCLFWGHYTRFYYC